MVSRALYLERIQKNFRLLILQIRNPQLTAYAQCVERWELGRGISDSSSSLVRGSYCSALFSYAGLTSNVKRIPAIISIESHAYHSLVIHLAAVIVYLYVNGNRVAIVLCSLRSSPCSVV